MIARLWWKEMRTFWPAWLLLSGVGLGLQGALIASGADGSRSGFLVPVALCWAVLYAIVVASAAFAGEREDGTLGLLDALPVGRRTLWLGKATFALATTLGLALAMLVLGVMGTTESGASGSFGLSWVVPQFGTLLFEAVAWGLLWSALLRNPMVAGGLTLGCVGLVSHLADGREFVYVSDRAIPARLVVATLALAASAFAIAWRPRVGWSPRFLDDEADTPAGRARPIRIRPATPTRTLMWKAAREGRSPWLAAAGWAWVSSAFYLFAGGPRERAVPLVIVGIGLALAAGVAVFGGESAAGSQRFLLHLGVAPGRIWARTTRAWGIGLAAIVLGMLAILTLRHPSWWLWLYWRSSVAPDWNRGLAEFEAAFSFAAIADAFAVGLLAGMIFRRRITAALVAFVAWLAIVPLQLSLASMGMLPPWALLFTPAALLAISRAWAGDWLDARPGPARWLRLAAYAAAPSVVFSMAYIANRAWGIPDPGPVAVAGPAPSGVVPPGSDTAATYRRLAAEVDALGYKNVVGRDGAWVQPDSPAQLWDAMVKTPGLVDRIRKAAELPPLSRSTDAGRTTNAAEFDPTFGDVGRAAWLVDQHGRESLERGNPAGAWDDVLAECRMARQLTGPLPDASATQYALRIDRQATMLALDWAAHDKQTPDLLRKALADLRALPPFPTLGDVLKAKVPILERTFDLPAAELDAALYGPRERAVHTRVAESLLLYSAWERERARRVCRAEFKALIAASADESRRSPSLYAANERVQGLRKISPLAAQAMMNSTLSDTLNRATTGRRGLVQAIALRAWALAHGGTYPETLDVLVPDLLDRLPLDPYSARPFGYSRTEGQRVLRLDLVSQRVGDTIDTRPGQWLLFSVGPDDTQDSRSRRVGPPTNSDLVFPLP